MKLTREQTNLLGMVALAGVVIMFVILQSMRKHEIDDTKKLMSKIGQRFADNDKETIIAWNRHRLIDAWGTEFEVKNDVITGVVITSAGPDREFETKDDLVSDSYVKTPVVYADTEPEVESKESEAGGIWDKVKNRKWSFKWRWGGKDAENTEGSEE